MIDSVNFIVLSCRDIVKKLLFFSLCISSLLSSSLVFAQGAKRVPLPFSPIGINSLPWFVAKEARLYEKYGIDVDVVFIGASSALFQSMLSGAAEVAGSGGPAVITNVLKGGDIIQVAATVPRFTQSVITRPEIKKPEEMKGKKIGISRLGTVTHFALQTALDGYGVKGVTILQMGGQPEALAGLARGSIDGAVVSPPQSFQLIKQGFHELVSPDDLQKLGAEFITNGLVARKAVVEKDRDTLIRVIKSTMEGVKVIVTDANLTKKVITKYLRITDPILLEESYRFATGNFPKEPFVPEGAIRAIVKQMMASNLIDAKLASSTPLNAYFDNRYVEEVKRSGFFDQLWR